MLKTSKSQTLIKILLAEDHNIVRKGIRSLLEKEPELEVIGEASCGQELLDMIANGVIPDVVVTDLNMPGISGSELVERLKSVHPTLNVLILSMIDQEDAVIRLVNAGANGYILKNVSHEEMVYAISQAAKGNLFICSEIVSKINAKIPYYSINSINGVKTEVDLSKREIEVLSLIAEGYTNIEIAEKLFMSRRTVEGHRQNLLEKTGTKNTATLIRFAIRNELID